MYFWKCWRDTRLTFFGYLIALLAATLFMVISPGLDRRAALEWDIVREAKVFPAFRQAGMTALVALGMLILGLAGMALGSATPGRERSGGSLDFLLTRPRTRKFIYWRAWAFSALEIVAMITVSTLAVFLLILWLTRGEAFWRLWLLTPGLFVIAMLCYGLSASLTVWLEDGHKGLSAAILVTLAYFLLTMTFGSTSPSWSMSRTLFAWVMETGGSPWTLPTAFWVALAVVLPFIGWWRFSRIDI